MARVLHITDRHKRYGDFSTIRNYRRAMQLVDSDILEFVKREKITHIISYGDLFDGGYKSVASMYDDTAFEKMLSEEVNGNYYMCIGNHFFHERDSNPEMYLTQPGGKYPPKQPVVSQSEPIIKTPDIVRIGCAQFSLCHYDKQSKEYFPMRESGVRFHMGIFHDELVVPQSILSRYHMSTNVSSSYLRKVYGDLDYAAVGHLHNPIGQTIVNVGDKQVPLLIPGALCVTDSSMESRHTHVDLPVFDIDEDSCRMTLHKFSLHIEELQFIRKDNVVVKLPGLSEQPIRDVRDVDLDLSSTKAFAPHMDVESFLKAKGHTEAGIELYTLAAASKLDMKSAAKILIGGQKSD